MGAGVAGVALQRDSDGVEAFRRAVDEAPLAVDRALRRLSRQEAHCRRVLSALADPFARVGAHQTLGFARVDDYARERLGFSGRELQELARVGRRLADLPEVAAAFEAGEVSWSHVRLLTSVATPDDERTWLARARGRSVRGLAALARASTAVSVGDPDDDLIDGEPSVRLHLRCPRRVRRLWTETAELASRMAGARIPAWVAAEAVAAEGMSSAAWSADASAGSGSPAREKCPTDGDDPQQSAWEPPPGTVPDDVRHLAVAITGNPHKLDARLRQVVRAMQRVDWQTGRLLSLMVDRRLHRELGFRSLACYARERLGMSVRRARALIAVDRRGRDHPELLCAYREGRVSLARALLLLPVLHHQTGAWITRAQEVTVRRLADMVGWALEVAEPGHPVGPPPADGVLVLPPFSEVQMCARVVDSEVRFVGPASVVGLLWTAIRGFTRGGEPLWRGFERLLLHARDEWRRQPRHRDPIFERDGWRCAVPACGARSSLHDHHVVYRSRGGQNTGENRVAICAAHHLRGIHGMRIKVTGEAPHDLTWVLGYRGALPPLLRTHGDRYLEIAP